MRWRCSSTWSPRTWSRETSFGLCVLCRRYRPSRVSMMMIWRRFKLCKRLFSRMIITECCRDPTHSKYTTARTSFGLGCKQACTQTSYRSKRNAWTSSRLSSTLNSSSCRGFTIRTSTCVSFPFNKTANLISSVMWIPSSTNFTVTTLRDSESAATSWSKSTRIKSS